MFICITILLYFRSISLKNEKEIISLQLAAFVTSIAAFHYYYMINSKNTPVLYRYFDWFFTTPILLIDLCILLDIFDYATLIKIVSLNTIMLLFGYLGELKILSILTSTILGFIPFVLMFYIIYMEKQKVELLQKDELNKNTQQSNNKETIFNVFILLWSLYGIVHMIPHGNLQNIIYNCLDLITKGFFGLFVFNQTIHFF
jgi:bacteriorhodopsin